MKKNKDLSLLDNWYVTNKLKKLGVTPKELKALKFSSTRDFKTWKPKVGFRSYDSLPKKQERYDESEYTELVKAHRQIISLGKVYAGVKWALTINDREISYAKNLYEVIKYSDEIIAEDLELMGLKLRVNNTTRAKRPRSRFTKGGKSIKDLVVGLISNPENHALSAAQLWPKMYAKLEAEGLDPENEGAGKKIKGAAYLYVSDTGTKHLSFKTFENLISINRKK